MIGCIPDYCYHYYINNLAIVKINKIVQYKACLNLASYFQQLLF